MSEPLDSAERSRSWRMPWILFPLVLAGCSEGPSIRPGDIRVYSIPKPAAADEAAPAAPLPAGGEPAVDPDPESSN